MPSLKEDHYEPVVLLHVEERIDDVVGHWVVLELRDLDQHPFWPRSTVRLLV